MFRRLGLALLGVLGLLIVLLAATFGVAQTRLGQKLIEARLGPLLSTPGAEVRLEGLSGFLPFDMALGHLAVGSAATPWLTATDLRLRWQLRALLDGRLQVEEAVVAELTLHDLPPATDESEDDEPLQLPELPRWLPPLTVERLAIEQLALAEAALGEAATFTLAGRLATDATRSVTLEVDLERVDEATAQASLEARLEAEPAVLELAFRVDETGGLLAAATHRAEADALHLVVEGRGPIDAFVGRLDLEAAGLGVVGADFDLGLGATRRLDLELALTPAANLPEPVRGLIGERATLTLAVAGTGPDQVAIHDLAVALAAIELNAFGQLDLAAETMAATGALVVADLAALAPLIDLPLAGAGQLQATVHGAMARPSGRVEMTLRDLQLAGLRLDAFEGEVDLDPTDAEPGLRLTGHGHVTGIQHAALDLPPRDLDLELQGVVPETGALLVEHLRLASAEIELAANGQLDPETLEGSGAATLEVTDLGPLNAAAGMPLGDPIGGGAELRLEAASGPAAARVTVDLEGTLDRLEGLPEALAAVLGSSATLAARAELIELRRLELSALQVTGAGARLDGHIGIDLDTQPIEAGALDGELALALAELRVLAEPLGLDLAGGLDGSTRLAGTLAAPAVDLAVTGQNLVIAGQPLDQLTLEADVTDALAEAAGQVRLALATKGVEASLSTAYRLQDSVLSLKEIALEAPNSRVDGNLEVDLADTLVTGRLAGETTDLAGVAPLLPLPLRGGVSLTAELSAGDGRQDARVDLDARGLGGPFGRVGHLALSGQLADLLGTPSVDATLTVDDLQQDDLRLERGQLRASGTTSGLGLEASLAGEATVPFALESRAELALAEAISLRLDTLTGTVADLPLQLEQPANLTLNGDSLRLDRLDLRLAEARAVGSLSLDPGAVDASLTLQPTPLALLARFGAPPLDGTIEARLTLSGAPGDPEGTLEIDAVDVEMAGTGFGELPPAELVGNATLAMRRLEIGLHSEGITREPLSLSIGLPLTLDLNQGVVEVPAEGRLEGRMIAEMALARLADVAGLHNDRLEGPLQVDLELGGTVTTPAVSGTIEVVGGLYEDGTTGTVLDRVTLRVRAEGQHLTIEELSATDGGEGRFSGSGELVLDPGRGFPVQLDLQLQRARLVQLDDLTATASGEIAIDGTATDMALTGKITIDRADATISGSSGPEIATIEVEEVGGDRPENGTATTSSSSTVLDLDLAIDMPGRVFVRGFGLVSEWKGQLQVTGPATAPLIGGRLEVRKGYFDLLDRRFDLRRGEILFTGASPPLPMLDIEATTQTAEIRAIVHIHDRATRPKIDFESEPPLPEDEVLSYVLFGEQSSELSAMQAAQLVSAANRLTGGIDPLGDLRGSLGIDTLDLGHDATTSDTKVRAGKYLTDEIYLEVESGQAEQSGRAKVEVEILPGVSVQADTGEDQKNGVGLEWRYDY